MKTSDSQLPSNKSFGYFFAFIFLVIGSYFFFANLFFLYVIFFSLAILFILSSIFFPDYLFILNKLWMKFGMVLATIINDDKYIRESHKSFNLYFLILFILF